jgi:hypothetical protein
MIAKGSVPAKEKKSLEELDFQLPDGQRRRSHPAATRKFCPPVDYGIHFTDLKDPKGPTLSGDFPDNLSDEDLPATILSADGSFRSNKRRNDNQNVEQPESSQPPRKCPRQSLWTSVGTSGFCDTLKKNEDFRSKGVPLLLQADSCDDGGSIENSSPVPSMTTRGGENEQFCKSWLGKQRDISEAGDERDDLTGQNTSLKEVPAIPQPTDHVMDELAELEEWLESGAFEVV